MSKKIQKAVFGSDKTPLRLGTIDIPCYVLEDGTRVLSGRGIQKAIGYTGASGDWLKKQIDRISFSAELKAGVLSPIKFKRVDAGGSQPATYGYEATLLIDICNELIDLKKAGVLSLKQMFLADAAEVIIRAVAKVGIISLIDEATGYQEVRGRQALQEFFDKFFEQEKSKWVRRFPHEYFKLMFEMRGWTWNEASTKKPGVVGKYINDQIYDRIAPGVRKELERLNPPNETGKRKAKHHQWLTTDVGHPALEAHISGIMALQRASGKNWSTFKRLLARAYPKFGDTPEFDFENDD
jgi:hypothetical protein